MGKPGRELERVVALLEKCLGPEGAEIKSPDFIPDRITGEPREVDASIRYKVGSAPILVTVECRDRARVEDVTWIEQLAQKRSDLNAAKTVAVSTEGFSKQAIEKAEFHGIELRTFSEVTEEVVGDWFAVGEMTFYNHRATLHAAGFVLDGTTVVGSLDIPDDNRRRFERPNLDDSLFALKSTGELCSIRTMLDNAARAANVFEKIPQDGTVTKVKLENEYPPEGERYRLELSSGSAELMSATFWVDVWVETKSLPIDRIHSYASSDGALIDTVEYEVERVSGKQIFSLHLDRETRMLMASIRRDDE